MDRLKRSAAAASILILALFTLLIARLFWLQVLDYQQLGTISSSNSVRRIWVQPPRGRMLDCQGRVLVDNQPLYSIKAIPSEFKPSRTAALAMLLGMSPAELEEAIEKGRAYNRFAACTIKRDPDETTVTRVSENLWRLPGVFIEAENKRKYADSLRGSHLFGYLRLISREQLAELSEHGYGQDDKIGFSGLERQYEERLRGRKGARFEMVTPLGKVAGSYDDGQSDIAPVRGDDLLLHIDGELQGLAEELLAKTGRSGAVIAMDPRDGGILAMASAPDYDLEVFNGSTDGDGWKEIIGNPDKPLFNRTVQAVYPPGSTYKMLLAMAALEGGRRDPEKKILDGGSFTYGNRRFLSHGGEGHGMVDMHRAITVSSNVYFYSLMFDVGFEEWTRYGELFGFGRSTGIDLPGERDGLLPSSDYYDRRYGKGRWTQGYLVSLAIGQGELGTTPLQLAAYTSALANGGTLWQPRIVSGYRDSGTGRVVPLPSRQQQLPLSQETFRRMQSAMESVVEEGTGQMARVPGIRVAGKTGTAQNPHGRDHAWFVAFAPVEAPTIAIAVLVENAGYGGSISAPIAGRMIARRLGVETAPKQPATGERAGSAAAPDTLQEKTEQPAAETAPTIENDDL